MSREELPLASPRSWASIEADALHFVHRFYPKMLAKPGPIPIEHFIEFVLPKHKKAQFDVAPLPHPSEAITIPGDDNRLPRIIMASEVFDRLLAGNGRARFTAAHECGHVIYHMQEFRKALVSGTHKGLYRKPTIPPYMNPERQADVFASRMLMPEPAVRLALQILGPNVRDLAELFQVSYQAMSVRLGEIRGR